MKNLFLILIACVAGGYCGAQPHAQSVVSAQGDYFWSPTVSVAWTLGEVISETYAPGNMYLTQGFHQPGYVKKDNPEISFDSFNGFSPNGDGINDNWHVPILDQYKDNKVVILNRWGNEVWAGSNYDNKEVVFEGRNMNGDALPDGTYYYILQYNNIEKRGWVFIKR